jgi:hypothetical protein
MPKSVSLTVHRNKVENRRKRDLSKTLRSSVEHMVREQDIRAYAVVGIAADGKAYTLWDTGAVLPMWAFADTVAHVLREDIRESGIEDDWRPTLKVGGSR